jgi:hypothetical protein
MPVQMPLQMMGYVCSGLAGHPRAVPRQIDDPSGIESASYIFDSHDMLEFP